MLPERLPHGGGRQRVAVHHTDLPVAQVLQEVLTFSEALRALRLSQSASLVDELGLVEGRQAQVLHAGVIRILHGLHDHVRDALPGHPKEIRRRL